VWLYHVFSLSLRDVELLLAEGGVIVAYESVRRWCLKFGRNLADKLRRRRRQPGDTWHLKCFCGLTTSGTISGARSTGTVSCSTFVQDQRNAAAAKRFFKRLLRGLRYKRGASSVMAFGAMEC